MRTLPFLLLAVISWPQLYAQKKPLDHTVYDNWQSMGERKISPDGKWVVYVVDVQEGDGQLYVQRTDNSYKRQFPRGYNITISPDSRYAVFRIRPPYAETRQARIKKKKPEEMPKDSLAIVRMGTDSVYLTDRVKSYRMAEKDEDGWVAIHLEKNLTDTSKRTAPKDSLRTSREGDKTPMPQVVEQKPDTRQKMKLTAPPPGNGPDMTAGSAFSDAEGTDPVNGSAAEGTDLIIRHLSTGEHYRLPFVTDYTWSKKGNVLLTEGTTAKSKPGSLNTLAIWRTLERRADTISRGANDYRNFAFDEDGRQLAFVAERDSTSKALQKTHKLWYWQNGTDTARMIVDRNAPGMPVNWSVSENATPSFSRNGERILFGTAPVVPARDTGLVEIDLVRLDVWHYNDEYLQPQQLRNLEQELKRSYLASYDLGRRRMVQLADRDLPRVIPAAEGDGDTFVGLSDKATRISGQWKGRTYDDVYAVDVRDGSRKQVAKGVNGNPAPSPAGRYIWWYDATSRHYVTWAEGKTSVISVKVPVALHDELFDMPDDPNPYGPVRWLEKDEALLVYDRYDIWQLDPQARKAPLNLTAGAGRKSRTVYRYLPTDPTEQFIKNGQRLLLRSFREDNKESGLSVADAGKAAAPVRMQSGSYSVGNLLKARDTNVYVYTKESFVMPPDLYAGTDLVSDTRLSRLNPQQDGYNWGTAELFRWKSYDGKEATGILYKPENFDPARKYPLIAYFYERLSDGLHSYLPPSPTPSRLNIPFFVSRGYLVLAPDIAYRKGYPGKSAFDHVVSGVRAVVKKGWADSTRLGLQGQSWGGYQAAHIITRTPLFRAAWAGAPVANMTSAYGGIRWESGVNRQFQYEHSQSRIGASLWEQPGLYIENSPLFHLKGVQTPLVIMSNDADGAVPWYQGIEMFTAMRRLGKKVWLLNYNGEAHNLVERRNRKDIQIREQQFFDWLLKGEKPPKWITEGVPATQKGKDWGLGY